MMIKKEGHNIGVSNQKPYQEFKKRYLIKVPS